MNDKQPMTPAWGQIVQLLLRALDSSPRGENTSALAERMATAVQALYAKTASQPRTED